jgi:hypothetical protein
MGPQNNGRHGQVVVSSGLSVQSKLCIAITLKIWKKLSLTGQINFSHAGY